MRSFENRWVYITGGSSGIGKACACLFAGEGAHIVLIARNQERLARAQEEVAAACRTSNQEVLTLPLDVSQGARIRETLGEWMREHPGPDVLITSAGVAYPNYFERIPDEWFERTIDTNLKGTWYTVHSLYPAMKQRGSGYIVMVSSMAGYIGVFGYTAYSASKFGIIGFASCLRSEAELHGITVSVLCPPDTDTPQLHEEEKTKPPETKAVSGTVKPVPPEFVARELLKGMRKRRFLITPGLEGTLIEKINRHFPNLVYTINQAQVKRTAHH
ncbi:SDR family oxidoreductase [Spirochaeta thermophila]|uniref:3-dehydrosphinganine reductase n=1 Tax=Winmispira thermophila (strain ATCC 49972 / DSM 6192 / RI 19.B1) TaxID=665571 RepID=E0RQS1_WINT6|nr:SDR family oxidoreductase [Spirochaeta thermophila]ADN02977.1 follicular variant translocation protein 1 precursor [Spirochaeta thermophila DSM 6192]